MGTAEVYAGSIILYLHSVDRVKLNIEGKKRPKPHIEISGNGNNLWTS